MGAAPKSCCATISSIYTDPTTQVSTSTVTYFCLPQSWVFYQTTAFKYSSTTSYYYDCSLSNYTAPTVCSTPQTLCGTNNCCMSRSGQINSVTTTFRGVCMDISNEGSITYNGGSGSNNLVLNTICMSNSGTGTGTTPTPNTTTGTGGTSNPVSGVPVGGYGSNAQILNSLVILASIALFSLALIY
eukprot:403347299